MPLPFDPATQRFVVDRDGDLGIIKQGEEEAAARNGAQPVDLTRGLEMYRAVEAKEEAGSLKGQVRTLATSTFAGALAPIAGAVGGTGEQAVAGLFGSDGEDIDRIYEQQRIDAEANPSLQAIGSTLGTAYTAYAGGELLSGGGSMLSSALGADAVAANMAGSGLIGRIGAKALTAAPTVAGMAVEGGLGGIGGANEEAFLQNRELAADEVAGAGLIGAGLSLGIGAGFRGLGYAGSKAAQKVSRAIPEGALEKLAGSSAFKSAIDGAPTSVFRGINQEGAEAVGRRLLDEGIPLKASKEAVELLSGKLNDAGRRKGVIEALAHGHLETDPLIAKIREHAAELAATPTAETEALSKKLLKQADQLEKAKQAGTLDIDKLAETKSIIGKRLEQFKKAKNSTATEAYSRLYSDMSGTVESAIQKADDALGGQGKWVDEWHGINDEYGQLKGVKNAYTSKLEKEAQNRVRGGFGDQILGGNVAALGSVVTGNIGTGALLGIGTGMARKAIRENGYSWVAHAANRLAQGGEVPSVTKLLAASSQARQQLGKYAVSQMVQRGARKAVSAAEESPAGFAYGALANYSDPKQVNAHYADASGYLERSQGDIEGMASRANQHLGALAEEQPELAAAAQVKMARAIDYLRETQPVSPPQSVLAASFGNVSKSLPPTYQQVSWLKRFRATVDPSVIYGEIARGVVNPETVETLQTLYPAYYASVVEGTLSGIHENPEVAKSMTYSQRLALDNLMGGTGQVEPTRRFSVQDRLAQANAEVQQNTAAPPPSSRKTPEIAKLAVTTSDRLMTL